MPFEVIPCWRAVEAVRKEAWAVHVTAGNTESAGINENPACLVSLRASRSFQPSPATDTINHRSVITMLFSSSVFYNRGLYIVTWFVVNGFDWREAEPHGALERALSAMRTEGWDLDDRA